MGIRIQTLAVVALLANADAQAPADDAKLIRDAPVMYTDGKGHYFGHARIGSSPTLTEETPTFHGDAKTLFLHGRANWQNKHLLDLAGPPGMYWNFVREPDGRIRATCGKRNVPLQAVTDEAAKKLTASARFEPALKWNRIPVRLARDDEGTYYYVDAANPKHEQYVDHRVYIGKRGAVKAAVLKDVVSDPAGALYITNLGTLKFSTHQQADIALAKSVPQSSEIRATPYVVVRPDEARWLSRGRTTILSIVPHKTEDELVYADLGAYTREKFGSPCDVF